MRLNGRIEALEQRMNRSQGPRIFAKLPTGVVYVLAGPRICVPPRDERRKGTVAAWMANQPGSWRRVRPGEPIDESRSHEVPDLAVFGAYPPLMTNAPTTGQGSPSRVKLESVTEAQRRRPIARSID